MSTQAPQHGDHDRPATRRSDGDAATPEQAEHDQPHTAALEGHLEGHATLLSKAGDAYHGGVERRSHVLRHLQRRMGNSYTQRVIARSQQARAQADPDRAEPAHAALPHRGALIVQRDLAASMPTSQGIFDIDMIAKNGAATGGQTGLRGTIKFTPGKGAPYSNKIGLIQIVKLTDAGGTNVDPASMPAGRGKHLRTDEDKAAGVEKGFFTDVLHQDFTNPKGPKEAPPGSALLPYYPFAPLSRKAGDIFGFKRSDDPADIKDAELFDFPGTTNPKQDLDFSFETVAKGDDTMNVYGAIKWSFGIRAGKVVNEQMSVADGQSATLDAALDKHRDFYVHEPVTFYFGFDEDQPLPGETDKIDTFLDYLRRFPDVQLDLAGFADQRGNAAYNRNLALRRAESIAQALIEKGIDPARIRTPRAVGATTQFTDNAVTDQDEEANRRGNRRVTLTFEHTASIAPGGTP